MTQELTIRVENDNVLGTLRKMLRLVQGVTIVRKRSGVKSPTATAKKTELDRALDDINKGKVYSADNVDDMFNQILGDKWRME